MKKNLLLWLIAIVTFSLTGLQSCKRKTDYQINPNAYDNSKMVVASFYGQLIDEAGLPIENATVTTSGYTTQTDVNGLYFFNNINTPEHNTCIKASKIGFFNGFRSMMVKAGDKHEVKLTLMKKDNAQTFSSSAGGTISTGDGLSISFPASAIKNKATGLPYNGQVYVYAKRIDPTTSLGRNTMPGDLRGIRQDQNESMLRSFGMLVAELYDASGNALQLANNQEATISLDIPASIISSAPASIPLWYFDEAKGTWVEEGLAMLQGNKYVGTVKHFSFWNCDTPEAAIQLEMTLVDQNNNPLSGYTVKLINTANLDQRYGNTNASGWVGGMVYSNATLTMEVYPLPGICSNIPMYTQTITTGAVNQNLGTITVNITTPASTTFTGTIVDCANNPISNACLLIQPLGLMIIPNATGQFSYTMPCTPVGMLTYYAYDLSNNVYGSSTGTAVPGINMIGNQSACGNVSQFLNITLTNTVTLVSATKNFIFPVDNVWAMVDSLNSNSYSNIAAYGSGGYVEIQANDSTVGSHPAIQSSLFVTGTSFTDTQFTLNSGSVNYTSFPLFPGDAIGTFTLNLTGSPSGNTYTATGNFRAPRSN